MSKLDALHWQKEDYAQRMTKKDWKEILLNHEEKISFNGRVRTLVCRDLGYGVLEVYKKPL